MAVCRIAPRPFAVWGGSQILALPSVREEGGGVVGVGVNRAVRRSRSVQIDSKDKVLKCCEVVIKLLIVKISMLGVKKIV